MYIYRHINADIGCFDSCYKYIHTHTHIDAYVLILYAQIHTQAKQFQYIRKANASKNTGLLSPRAHTYVTRTLIKQRRTS